MKTETKTFWRLPDGFSPNTWEYFCEDGYVATGNNAVDLLWSAFSHYQSINAKLDYRNLPIMLEDQLSRRFFPDGKGVYSQDGKWVKPSIRSDLTANDIVSGSFSLLKGFVGLVPYVSQAEANRRASVCVECLFNVRYNGCNKCGVRLVVHQLRGNHSTPYDEQLDSCAECKCFLEALVWWPLSKLPINREKLPPHCWKLNESQEQNRLKGRPEDSHHAEEQGAS